MEACLEQAHLTRCLYPLQPCELVADIHDRMPVILAPDDYARWLGDEPDPRDLMRPFPAALMRMWPISTRVNKPANDDPSIVEPIELATDAA
jgi:putative SOS response-associated peptidase YedK